MEIVMSNKNKTTSTRFALATGFSWIVAVMFFAHPLAFADEFGNADSIVNGCMQDVYSAFGQGGSLNCTANDISLSTAKNIVFATNEEGELDSCEFPGDTVTFTADFDVVVTAGSRHDLGIYFAQDGDPNGDGALTGSCNISTPAYAPLPDWLDLDGLANVVYSGDIQDRRICRRTANACDQGSTTAPKRGRFAPAYRDSRLHATA